MTRRQLPLWQLRKTWCSHAADMPEIHLFGKWSCEDVQVHDISLQDYIAVKERHTRYMPHSAGRYDAKWFPEVPSMPNQGMPKQNLCRRPYTSSGRVSELEQSLGEGIGVQVATR